MMKFKVGGECFGIVVRERGNKDSHCEIVIGTTKYNGSDELDKKIIISSHWLAELSMLLKMTKEYLETTCEKGFNGYGYDFKEIKQEPKGDSDE